MPTTNDPRGRQAELYFAEQTNLLTPAVSPTQTFTRRQFYDFTPSPQSEPQDDEILGGGFHNSIDARPAAPDVERGSVRIAWPMDLTQMGWVLTELLGSPVTTGAGPYTHTWSSATAVIPTRTFERKLATGQFDGANGAVCRSLRFPIGSDRGYTRVDAEYFVRQVVEQYAVSIAGAPSTPAITARVPRSVGSIMKDGVALGSVISGDATITNALGEDGYAGSRLIDDVALEGRAVAINLTGRFKGAAMRDFGKVEVGAYLPTSMNIDLQWQLAVDLQLFLSVRNVRFAKVGVATAGPSRLDVPLRGRAEIGTGDSMVAAVLTNAQASYA